MLSGTFQACDNEKETEEEDKRGVIRVCIRIRFRACICICIGMRVTRAQSLSATLIWTADVSMPNSSPSPQKQGGVTVLLPSRARALHQEFKRSGPLRHLVLKQNFNSQCEASAQPNLPAGKLVESSR